MEKYFTEKQTNLATFLGGPIAGGLIIYRNFVKLDKKDEARIALSVTFLLSVVFFVLIFKIPDDKGGQAIGGLLSLVYTGISAIVFHRFLKSDVKRVMEEGGKRVSYWLMAAYTFGGILITITLVILIGMGQAPFEGDKLSFGVTGNEVYYDKGNISLEEIQSLATTLRIYGYFDDEDQKAVRIERNENVINVKIPLAKDLWENEDIIVALKSLRISLEESMKAKVKLVAEDYLINGETLYKTF